MINGKPNMEDLITEALVLGLTFILIIWIIIKILNV